MKLTVLKPFTYNRHDYVQGEQANFSDDVGDWLKSKGYASSAVGLTIPKRKLVGGAGKCPKCGKRYLRGLDFCPKCGAVLP